MTTIASEQAHHVRVWGIFGGGAPRARGMSLITGYDDKYTTNTRLSSKDWTKFRNLPVIG